MSDPAKERAEMEELMRRAVIGADGKIEGLRPGAAPPVPGGGPDERLPENVGQWRHDVDPRRRAIHWLVDFSWRDPDTFEELQALATALWAAAPVPSGRGEAARAVRNLLAAADMCGEAPEPESLVAAVLAAFPAAAPRHSMLWEMAKLREFVAARYEAATAERVDEITVAFQQWRQDGEP